MCQEVNINEYVHNLSSTFYLNYIRGTSTLKIHESSAVAFALLNQNKHDQKRSDKEGADVHIKMKHWLGSK